MKKSIKLMAATASALLLVACGQKEQTGSLTASGLDPQNFKSEFRGDSTDLYVLKNANGMEVAITNYGGRVVSIMVPDRDGNLKDVVLGFDKVSDYFPENNLSDFGAAIGRYANRINQGRFVLDGDTAVLPQNNFGHCLHGGTDMGTLGWQYRVYNAVQPNDSTLVLTIESPDGDNGFPGKVNASVTYSLTADNALDIDYQATSDKKTVINMTNHSYFNLSGNPENKITDNTLYLRASQFTPVDSTYMTTGEILPVKDTPMDFTTAKAIGQDIDNFDYEQLKNGNGYDHNFVIDPSDDAGLPVATLYSPESGIQLDVFTSEPGIQVYTGNFLDGTAVGKGGRAYQQRVGVCLETQHYPDSPNKPQWPTATLNPGETYSSHTSYKFSTK